MAIITSPAPWGWQSADWMSYTGHRGKDYGWYNANVAQSRQVVAAAPGRVVEVYGAGGDNLGWGNRVVIEHAPGFRTTYSHLATGTIKVAVGNTVSAGQLIATMGNTGRASGIHLHFEVYLNGTRVDPNPWFSKHIPGTEPSTAHANDRVVGPKGANARSAASTAQAAVVLRKAGSLIRMTGFTREGQDVSGVRVWFQGADGYWYWAGGFTSQETGGLNDLTPAPPVVAPPVVAPPVVAPPVVAPPVVVAPEPEPVPAVTDENAPAWFIRFLRTIVEAITKFLPKA